MKKTDVSKLGRRRFMGLVGAAAVAGAASLTVPAQAMPYYNFSSRSLYFQNTHTGEQLGGTYWAAGRYDPRVLRNFCYILRDHRAEEQTRIDPRLFDVLHQLQARLRDFAPLKVVSAYRSPQTNRWLASQSSGVARNSYHVRGQAIDLRLDDTPVDYIYRAALSLQAGGVGYYPASDFVHVDTGPIRTWGRGIG